MTDQERMQQHREWALQRGWDQIAYAAAAARSEPTLKNAPVFPIDNPERHISHALRDIMIGSHR